MATIRFHRITATSGSTIKTDQAYVKGDVYFIKSATGNTGKVYICTVAGTGTAATLEDYSVDTNTWRPVVNNLTSTSTDSSLSAAMGKSLNDSITSLSNSLASHTHDGRYYTESEVNDLLANKSNTGHTHTKSQITDFAHTHDDRYYTESEIDTKLATKSDTGHTHAYLPLSGGELVGKTAIIGQNTGAETISANLDALVIATKQPRAGTAGYYYPGIAFNHMWNWDGGKSYQNSSQAWVGLKLHSTPGSELSYLVFGTKEGTGAADRPIERMSIAPNGNVNIKRNLSVDGSLTVGGVSVSLSGHNHDDRYYTESEIDTKLATKSDTGHTHTKSQITDFAHTHTKSQITDFAHTHTKSDITDFAHTHTRSQITDFAHTHDDRYYTESEIDTKLATKSDTGHTHTKSQITDFPTSLPANGGYANEIASKDMLDSQEKIDNFITPNRFEYALFKTTDANNVDFASNDGMILSIPWSSNNYGVQLAFDDTLAGTIKVRGKSNSWGNWYTLLHSDNYTSYTVKKDGTGATGTWGINISGNAATATNAGYATTAGSAPASDVYSWAKQSTKPPYTGTEVTLSEYSKNSSYTPIASGDSVQAAIAKLEGALSGLEDLLASI